MPHALPNDLRLRLQDFRKDQNNLKTSSNYNLVHSLPLKKKIDNGIGKSRKIIDMSASLFYQQKRNALAAVHVFSMNGNV